MKDVIDQKKVYELLKGERKNSYIYMCICMNVQYILIVVFHRRVPERERERAKVAIIAAALLQLISTNTNCASSDILVDTFGVLI